MSDCGWEVTPLDREVVYEKLIDILRGQQLDYWFRVETTPAFLDPFLVTEAQHLLLKYVVFWLVLPLRYVSRCVEVDDMPPKTILFNRQHLLWHW